MCEHGLKRLLNTHETIPTSAFELLKTTEMENLEQRTVRKLACFMDLMSLYDLIGWQTAPHDWHRPS